MVRKHFSLLWLFSFVLLIALLIVSFFFQAAGLSAYESVITFNDLANPNRTLNGQYPSGVVNWGSNQWYLSAPWGGFSTNSVSFTSASAQSTPFTFVVPSLLSAVDVYNGGSGSTTITLSCAGNPTITQPVSAGQVMTITTNWTTQCATVTVGSTNGWSSNFDNFAFSNNSPTPAFTPTAVGTPTGTIYNGHNVLVDGSGRILSWLSQPYAYKGVIDLAWDYIKNKVPNGSNGVKHYLTYCCFFAPGGGNHGWYHNPAGLYAMFVDSLVASYPYSGDASLIPIVKQMLDYQLANGTTPSNWDWPNVPFASSVDGDLIYRGDGNSQRDGTNGIEPDKVAELGYAYLRFWQLTGNTTYRAAAINCANALASHVRAGDATHSPWPFRVHGQTGQILEEYTANMVPAVRLFDELIRLNLGQVSSYQTARNTAWNWVLAYPMQNNRWNGYFEDMPRDPNLTNLNQITPMETARYILSHEDPSVVDPNWQTNIPALMTWVKNVFGKGPYFGAQAIDEQTGCCSVYGLGSHTARWASINALWYERTGDTAYLENAYRAFNYATYMAGSDGVVVYSFGEASVWYSDGYGDYIKHFMEGMGAVPAWSPAGEDHLLRSSSVVTSITYQNNQITFSTFDPQSREVLRLGFTPLQVIVDGISIPNRANLNAEGWMFDPASGVLRIRHDNGRQVVINGTNLPDPPKAAPRLYFSDNGDISLSWNRLSWADGYQIQVGTSASFTLPLYLDNASLPASQLSLALTGVPDGTYYWRVRARDGSGVWRSWSAVQSFRVLRPAP
jgi:hypothetical protein